MMGRIRSFLRQKLYKWLARATFVDHLVVLLDRKRIMKLSSMDSRCYIPENLVFDILLWLPVTSLLRFKSVCKSWYTLVDSPIFISQHFNRNSGSDNLLGMHVDTASVGCRKFCLLSGNKYEVYNNFDCGLPMIFYSETERLGDPETKLAFSSNGIICLIHYGKYITLWNPATRQLRSLTIPYQKYSLFGFGFNVKSNDHNIVRTTLCEGNTFKNLIEVYSLRADSWRTMQNDFAIPSSFYYTPIHQITKVGKCFWKACSCFDTDTDGKVILSFDLNEETYETISLPGEEVLLEDMIDFLGDKLAYIHCVKHHHHCYYEIWILHEYGVKESWNKAWKIGPVETDVLFPSRFISNGEYLLFTDDPLHRNTGIFSLYDLGMEENEYLELQQPNLRFCWYVRYTESLYPIKRVNDVH